MRKKESELEIAFLLSIPFPLTKRWKHIAPNEKKELDTLPLVTSLILKNWERWSFFIPGLEDRSLRIFAILGWRFMENGKILISFDERRYSSSDQHHTEFYLRYICELEKFWLIDLLVMKAQYKRAEIIKAFLLAYLKTPSIWEFIIHS